MKYDVEPSRLHPILDTVLSRWLLVLAWMALIFFLSAQPQLPSPPDALANLLFKKASHFAAYAVLAVLFWRALPPGKWAMRIAWVLAVLYAASDEWHQSFVPNRHAQVTDVMIDACGAVTALLSVWWLRHRSKA